jgi:hypothetical protein
MRKCKICGEHKSIDDFQRHKNYKDGLRNYCKKCHANYNRKWRSKNIRKCLDRSKAYYNLHKYDLNRKHNQYFKERCKTDINYKISHGLRSRLNVAVRVGYKSGSAVRDIGCSIECFKNYIENQFLEGMSWSNHGRSDGQWSIDHIKPLVSFDLSNRDQFLEACHYTNLRPMWHVDNLRKGSKSP